MYLSFEDEGAEELPLVQDGVEGMMIIVQRRSCSESVGWRWRRFERERGRSERSVGWSSLQLCDPSLGIPRCIDSAAKEPGGAYSGLTRLTVPIG